MFFNIPSHLWLQSELSHCYPWNEKLNYFILLFSFCVHNFICQFCWVVHKPHAVNHLHSGGGDKVPLTERSVVPLCSSSLPRLEHSQISHVITERVSRKLVSHLQSCPLHRRRCRQQNYKSQ